MNVTVRLNRLEFEVRVEPAVENGVIADLVVAIGGEPEQTVAVDGRIVGPMVPLKEAGIRDGSTIEINGSADPRSLGTLVQIAGRGAGTRLSLDSGSISIGEAPADTVVDGVGARIFVLADHSGALSLRNPERISVVSQGLNDDSPTIALAAGDHFQVGDAVFTIVAITPGELPRGGTFNRPPRPVTQRSVNLLEPPPPPQEPAKPMRFGWAALIVPVVLGLTMAVLIHPRMAMFAVFSPAMLMANWFEDKRRLRKERKEFGEAHRDRLARFAADVARAHASDAEALRRTAVTPQELLLRAASVDSRLWERRCDHDDFLTVPIGVGCIPWNPELVGAPSPEAKALLARYEELHDVPISIRFDPGDVTGLAGDRPRVLPIARQILLQAALHQGPADLAISIFTERPSDWDWAKWLPHVVVDSSGRRRIAGTPDEIAFVAALLPSAAPAGGTGPRHLCIVDLPDLASGHRATVREVLRNGKTLRVSAVALASRSLDLPSLSTTIISAESARCRIRFPDGHGTEFLPWRTGTAEARSAARSLARVDDPESGAGDGGLPPVVHLEALLGLGATPGRSIRTRWSRPTTAVAAPIGVENEGPLHVDLLADGPHALLGGTTGAGKSELLRTLVASLATNASPSALNFVLIDYKGGSAFDACAALPHTVGLVTDLDEHLAKRALICLDAELRYREHRLRSQKVSDIESFVASSSDPLPRLLVVIDEFAALAKELPDFIDALVGIAQRGRSLGVHLLLATQRPSGVIGENIKANTNLRIALRMQDVADSVDVIGCPEAASIGRNQPGRGLARFGPSDVVPFQAALVTGRSMSAGSAKIVIKPFVFAHEQPGPAKSGTAERDDGPTDLERIVVAACSAANDMNLPEARRPWPDALPLVIHLDDLQPRPGGNGATAFGFADEPHRQRQLPASWEPAAGNLLLYGLPGSGTTTALASIAVGMARGNDPDRLHIHVFDFDDQELHPLQDLPHVGAVVGAGDRERQLRLLRRLATELQDRRDALAGGAVRLEGQPTIVTILDNFGGFADAFGDPGDIAVHNLVARLVADGPGVDMMTIIAAKHPGDIPTRIASLVASRLVFRLADRYDYSGLGVPPVEPPTIPGRAFESGTGREVQVALPHAQGLVAAVGANRWGPAILEPWSTDVLPHDVRVVDVAAAGRIAVDEWFLPLGIGDTALTPAGLILREGEHALITGPARSGKSTALATAASVAKAADPQLQVVAVLPRRSPLSDCSAIDVVVDLDALDDLSETDRPRLLLVDDAEMVGDSELLSEVIKTKRTGIKVVAAGSADVLRGLYGHWTQDIRRSRIGCALRPNLATDGELWQTPLPRRGPEVFPVGRGYLLAEGQCELVQLGMS